MLISQYTQVINQLGIDGMLREVTVRITESDDIVLQCVRLLQKVREQRAEEKLNKAFAQIMKLTLECGASSTGAGASSTLRVVGREKSPQFTLLQV